LNGLQVSESDDTRFSQTINADVEKKLFRPSVCVNGDEIKYKTKKRKEKKYYKT